MDIVRGKLPIKNYSAANKLQETLTGLGYEVSSADNSLFFSKPTQIEAVVNELTPIVEKAGWNVWTDLSLSQESTDKATTAVYQDGRVVREFPRGV